jgi:hypothetical protein
LDSILFWNQAPPRNATRSVDPLGFDALREAMADNLVPLLTGATRDADEYLWTLIGLRWAHEQTGASVDATIFYRGFAPFERALKQYWYRFRNRRSGGINVVKKLCQGNAPELRRQILTNERAAGLLGNYIVSLRGMGLVQKESLVLAEEAVDRLLVDVRFSSARGWASSWPGLKKTFDSVDLKAARRRLGVKLFGENHNMRRAASAALARPNTEKWSQVDRSCLDLEQARIAQAAAPVLKLEKFALNAFSELLSGKKKLSEPASRALRSCAEKVLRIDPIPSSWSSGNKLRESISDAFSSLAGGSSPTDALLKLHLAVTRDVRHTEPWILRIGDTRFGDEWRPRGGGDFRFKNLRKLLGQTRWKADAD